MSKYRTAINGFGRIGRTLLKEVLRRNEIDVVAIHDLADMQTLLHLLKYDSTQGIFEMPIEVLNSNTARIGGKEILFLQNLSEYPWNEFRVDLVFECTGTMKTEAQCEKHINNGAKRVLLSAPCEDQMPMWIVGVNDHNIDLDQKIISCASCTTNNAAPMIKVLKEMFPIEYAYISTVHSYTSDQRLHDAPHKDLRRARAAANSIVPTTTGASKAITRIFPDLDGKIAGGSVRVPVINGSMTELTLYTNSSVTATEINTAFKRAAETNLKGIVGYTEDPIVSVDSMDSELSCLFDSQLTTVMGKLIKVVGWYDNEAGYSNRLKDLVRLI